MKSETGSAKSRRFPIFLAAVAVALLLLRGYYWNRPLDPQIIAACGGLNITEKTTIGALEKYFGPAGAFSGSDTSLEFYWPDKGIVVFAMKNQTVYTMGKSLDYRKFTVSALILPARANFMLVRSNNSLVDVKVSKVPRLEAGGKPLAAFAPADFKRIYRFMRNEWENPAEIKKQADVSQAFDTSWGLDKRKAQAADNSRLLKCRYYSMGKLPAGSQMSALYLGDELQYIRINKGGGAVSMLTRQ